MLVLTRRCDVRGLAGSAVSAAHYHALGRLLLVFTVFWAYIAYSQGFLIWIANLPHEVTWYVERWDGGWRFVLGALILGRFAIPFLVLLSRSVKRDGRKLAWIGAFVLGMHWVDVFWLVLPSLPGGRDAFHWLDPLALAAVSGTTIAFASWRLDGRWLLPRRDPALAAAMEYHSP